MYHSSVLLVQKKCRLDRRQLFENCDRLLVGVLALLVCHAAAGLAGGLAGSLALTAAAVLGAVAQATSLEGLDSFHNSMYLRSVKF